MPKIEHEITAPKRSLAELMAEQRAIYGDSLPLVPGWGELPVVGLEITQPAELPK